MKILFLSIGKTSFPYLREGTAIYEKRLDRYASFESRILPDVRNAGKMGSEELKRYEGEKFLKVFEPTDLVVLLDEAGKQRTSVELAGWLDRSLQSGKRRLVFVVGGAYGFSPAVYERADQKMALSKLTFSHQMIRLFFLEQLYRAFTILRGEPYHNS